jgi:hypothetical protein
MLGVTDIELPFRQRIARAGRRGGFLVEAVRLHRERRI